MKTIFEVIGEKISRFIEMTPGMTQTHIANELGVSKQVMSKIVNGKKATNIEEIQKIAEIMNISVDELVSTTSTSNIIEEPVLFMMEKTHDQKVRQHLQYLDFIMDRVIEVEEQASKLGARTYE